MKSYTVKSLSISGKGRRVFSTGDTVFESDFHPGSAEILCKTGHLVQREVTYEKIKIGILIPTRGCKERKIFLDQAKELLSRQTLHPDEVEIMNDPPAGPGIDITWRYRTGCTRLFQKGCDLVIFFEEDDWYAPNYIEQMVLHWNNAYRPAIFGIGNTTYYHVLDHKHFTISHPKRASAMSTAVTRKVLDITWGPDDDPYTDITLWKELRGSTFIPSKPLCVGIKHNIGMVGGGGHVTENFPHYKYLDPSLSYLKWAVGLDFPFYQGLKNYFVKKVVKA